MVTVTYIYIINNYFVLMGANIPVNFTYSRKPTSWLKQVSIFMYFKPSLNPVMTC
jgi:hypothetical protein